MSYSIKAPHFQTTNTIKKGGKVVENTGHTAILEWWRRGKERKVHRMWSCVAAAGVDDGRSR